MPQSLKVLSTITAWVLFILGWVGVVAAIIGVVAIITGLFVIPNVTSLMLAAIFAGGVVCFILSVCAVKLRQMQE